MTGKFTLPDIREHFGDNEEEMQPQHSMFTVHYYFFFKKKHKDNRKNRKEEHTFHYLIQIVSLGDKRQDI